MKSIVQSIALSTRLGIPAHTTAAIGILLMTVTLTALVAQTGAAQAQEINLPQLLLGEGYGTFARGEESQIVIRVRDFSGKDDVCGTGFNLSQLGTSSDRFDFPHPGSRSISTDFPRSSGAYDFPRPGGSVSSFQLPAGSRSPQIVGCLDNQRNILFINIRPQVKPAPTPPVEPHPTPTPKPDTPPTGQIMLPQPPTNQNPTGFSPSYPVIK